MDDDSNDEPREDESSEDSPDDATVRVVVSAPPDSAHSDVFLRLCGQSPEELAPRLAK